MEQFSFADKIKTFSDVDHVLAEIEAAIDGGTLDASTAELLVELFEDGHDAFMDGLSDQLPYPNDDYSKVKKADDRFEFDDRVITYRQADRN